MLEQPDPGPPRLTALARTTLLVRDYEEALLFYRDLLGFIVLFDAIVDGRGRLLHVGLPGQEGVGLWFREAASEAELDLVGHQSGRGPFLVLYTDDCRQTCAALARRGVRFRKHPYEDGGAVVAHIEDVYGNELVIAQLPAGS